MKTIDRRHFLAHTAAIGAAVALPRTAWSQPLPGTARIFLGAPAGGSGDLMARKLADKLGGHYASNVIIENRPGAGGQLAIVATRDAAADGLNLLLVPSSQLSIYPYTYAKLPYKPLEDLAPVSLAAYANHGFAIGPAVPAEVKTLKDFIAWAKANPDKASYGSPASGSIAHLVVVVLAYHVGVELRHIPYRGSVQSLADLRGGTLPAVSGPLGAMLPHLKSGQLRVLAVSGESRSAFLPDVPTYQELGYPITAREWYGFFLPARADAAVVNRAAASLKSAIGPSEVAAIGEFGLEAATSTPQQLAQMLRDDNNEWRDLIKKVGFTAQS